MAIGANFGNLVGGIAEGGAYGQDLSDLEKLADTAHFSTQNYAKEGYAGDFIPEKYRTPEAAQYETISEDPRTRDYQMQALAKMQGYADNAANSAESMGRYNAISEANALAAQREAGVRNQMAMRGQGGSGMDAVLQAQAGQMAANRAQAGGLDVAQQAALQRLQGTQGVMAGAANVRGMDANVAGRNADIINQFNMANTGQRNAVAQGNVNNANQAGMRNVNTKQGIMGGNTGIANQDLNRSDRNRAADYEAKKEKTRLISQARHGNAGAAGQTAGGAAGLAGDAMTMAASGFGGK